MTRCMAATLLACSDPLSKYNRPARTGAACHALA